MAQLSAKKGSTKPETSPGGRESGSVGSECSASHASRTLPQRPLPSCLTGNSEGLSTSCGVGRGWEQAGERRTQSHKGLDLNKGRWSLQSLQTNARTASGGWWTSWSGSLNWWFQPTWRLQRSACLSPPRLLADAPCVPYACVPRGRPSPCGLLVSMRGRMAQLRGIVRSSPDLRISGLCPKENTQKALSTHPVFGGWRESKEC